MRRIAFLSILFLMVLAQIAIGAEAPRNLRIVDGSNNGPAPEWNFTVPRGPSRTTGVAPLYVHFSAGLTPSSPGNMPFHDYEYAWDFGDPGSGTWGTSGRSKNVDKGAVAAHVYEAPGTFTATLTVRNGDGVIDTERFTITVQDPNLVYSGTNTTCISDTHNNNFSGCPAGANRVATDNLGVLSSYTAAGRRVLLHRGSSWTVSSNIAFPNNTGPVHIGAYGACSSPDELGICANAPVVRLQNVTQFLNLDRKSDWRLADIAFTGTKTSSSPNAVGGVIDIKNFLALRIMSTGLNSPVGWSHWRHSDAENIDHNAIVSSKVTDFYAYGFYVGSERLALLGNVVRNSDTTHVVRVWQSYKGVIGHNIFSGSSLTNSNGRHAFKMHGPTEGTELGTYAQTGGAGLAYRTQLTVVSNNVFGSSGPWPVAIGPADAGQNASVSDILIEKNKFLAGYGELSPMHVQVGAYLSGRYMTARNNIIDGTGSSNGYTGIFITRRGIEWTPLGNRVYNNTIYSQENSPNGLVGVQVYSGASDTIVQNNYISFPNGTGPKTAVQDSSGRSIVSNNVITNTPYFLDPDNLNSLNRDFRLTSSASLAIGSGAKVSVYDDFFGNVRSTTYDLGAFAY